MKYSAVIVAAGSGTRMNLGYNKVYYSMDGTTILEKSMSLFLKDADCLQVVVVTDMNDFRTYIHQDFQGRVVLVAGGSSRQESVLNGLQAVLADVVFIHDGARPFLQQESLEKMKKAMETESAVCLCVPSKDTVKIVEDGAIVQTIEREKVALAQTPQAFRTSLLIDALRKAEKDGFIGTDDSSFVEKYEDVKVKVIEGSYGNRKITTPEDIDSK